MDALAIVARGGALIDSRTDGRAGGGMAEGVASRTDGRAGGVAEGVASRTDGRAGDVIALKRSSVSHRLLALRSGPTCRCREGQRWFVSS